MKSIKLNIVCSMLLVLVFVPLAAASAEELAESEQDRAAAEEKCSEWGREKPEFRACVDDITGRMRDYRIISQFRPVCLKEGMKKQALLQCICDKAGLDCDAYRKRVEERAARDAAVMEKERLENEKKEKAAGTDMSDTKGQKKLKAIREKCRKKYPDAAGFRKCMRENDPRGR